ncbi:MAG: class I tRNA ligase family protein, partial [Erysipelotrichales bacterium]|nr:class I tRNA ligase family protein [Erysipelotrichales bacterium]
MELKDTLLMPKTDFEMRGNLPKKEPLFLEEWAKEDLYNKMIEARKGNTPFVLHDGPPYANGNIHVGHALNKILKDIVVKSRAMMGYYTPFIPGWDTHGLPIENAIQKLGHNRKAMATSEFRKLCYDYALQQIEKQKSDFKRLGAFADYDHPYVTLHKEFEANQIKIFAKMAMDGLIYKGLKPVYWSPSSESALAEAEIEYHDIKSPTIYVAFKVVDGKGVLEGNESFVIWTTTPWTIPANLAICLNPDLEYAVCDTEKGKLIFLLELKEALQAEFKLEKCEVIKTFKGKELEFITAKHPFYDKTSLVILGDHVTSDAGTGCV